jgi:UPF0176 protein
MTKIHILLFYKYVKIDKPAGLKVQHLADCNKLGVKGRILLSEEGINGSVSGTKEQVELYKKLLTSDLRFSDIMFKEDVGINHPFKKMVIKIKNEIVRFGQAVNMEKVGKHLSPKEFLSLYDNLDNTIIIDARNDYEARVGKFKGAITLPIHTFTEFPNAVSRLNIPKDKKVVMYCTGGVRCEKASAFLKDQGYADVSQLNGGILNFGKEYPDTVWEGKCFVFDKRLLSAINSDDDSPISNCDICSTPCDLYKNCRNKNCDKYTIICINCDDKLAGNCSEACKETFLESRMAKVSPTLTSK